MQVKKQKLDDQWLTICEPELNREKPQETIVYYHGVGGEGIDELPFAYQLVEAGFRVILPDAYCHGKADRLSREEQNRRFFEIIDVTSQKLSKIYQWYLDTYAPSANHLYVGGTSMGGIITAIAVKKYPYIKKAAMLMGTAKLTDFYHYITADMKKDDFPLTEAEEARLLEHIETLDLSQDLTTLNHRDLFIWHGEVDKYVPFYLTEKFTEELRQSKDYQGHVHFIKEPGIGHRVSRLAKDTCCAFFKAK